MIVNRQRKVELNLPALRGHVGRVRAMLDIRKKTINVCLVDDRAMRDLNKTFRDKSEATDVLSFPWRNGAGSAGWVLAQSREFRNFLGDVAISVETAERQARSEGHPVEEEVRLLILHGTLHLLGYDHETDHGEMTALEIRLRERLGIGGDDVAPAGCRRMSVRKWKTRS